MQQHVKFIKTATPYACGLCGKIVVISSFDDAPQNQVMWCQNTSCDQYNERVRIPVPKELTLLTVQV